MSVLRSLESKIAGLVEGAFGRAFRSEVRPVELARRLAREMDEHKSVSVSRTYAPNEFRIWLSPEDRENFAGYEEALAAELTAYLLEHARSERLSLLSRPEIEFATDDRLALGEFGIQARLVHPGSEDEPAARQGNQGHTMVYTVAERLREPLEERSRPLGGALLVTGGRRLIVPPAGGVIGRSRDCDVPLDDANVSRRHAEVRPAGDAWVVRDLGSTNGTAVNGRPLRDEHRLQRGDRIAVGQTELVFELE